MHLVSSARNTILSDFADFKTKSTFHHANDEASDFQFFPNSQVFVSANRKSSLEILRIKANKQQQHEILRVRKASIDNLYCVAAAKQNKKHVALGLANGQVKLYNYSESVMVQRFNGDKSSVIFLDYNTSDEYVAAVYETGNINIYGTKTNVRVDNLNIDRASLLARFHPSKRCHLCIASNNGAVTLYDVQAKRKLYHTNDFHLAPCRDLCMSATAQELLITAGYDCLVNVFDMRRKTQPMKIKFSHPLSAVAMSECGNYFCVGNLKGELISYDLRQVKNFLLAKKVHESTVHRLAFVPFYVEQNGTPLSFDSVSSHSVEQQINDLALPKPIPKTQLAKRDSFCDFFLDHQPITNNKIEKHIKPTAVAQRDSFEWDKLVRNTNSVEQRISLFANAVSADNSLEQLQDKQNIYLKDKKPIDTSFVNTKPRGLTKSNESTAITNAAVPLRELSNNCHMDLIGIQNKLLQIQEEQSIRNQTADTVSINASDSDKENPSFEQPNIESQTKQIKSKEITNEKLVNGHEPKSANNEQLTYAQQQLPTADVSELRSEMLQRFASLESELRSSLEEMKWSFYTQSFNLLYPQTQNLQQIRDCLGVLMQTDPFVNEFTRLKQENEQLKQQLRKANGMK